MVKTSVYLTEAEVQLLDQLSKLLGSSKAEIIRSAIKDYKPAPKRRREFSMAGCVSIPGLSIADIPDEELLEGFGEDSLGEYQLNS